MNGNTPETNPRDIELVRGEADACFDEARVMAFVDGRLARPEVATFEKHLDECDACRELVAALAADEGAKPASIPTSDASRDALLRALDPDSLPPGTILADRFCIIEPLGTGATATTYRVADQEAGDECALKVLKDESGAGSRLVAKELVIARKLHHPNVCRVHDVGSADGVHFFGMELIHGETLEKALRRGIDPSAIMGILDQVCAGMGAAHQQGIVHRDLKPANIMIEGSTDRVVLMDFGLAADLDSEESRARIVGTPAYWAPEQARGEEPSKASDVYSFGLIAYKMFAGRPFKLSDPDALSHVPRACRAVVARCLDASPSARYQDASALRRALTSPPRTRMWIGVGGVVVCGVVGVVFATNASSVAPKSTATIESSNAHDIASTASIATGAVTMTSATATASVAPSSAPEIVAAREPALAAAPSTTTEASKRKPTEPTMHAASTTRSSSDGVQKAAISAPKSKENAAPSATSLASDLLYKR